MTPPHLQERFSLTLLSVLQEVRQPTRQARSKVPGQRASGKDRPNRKVLHSLAAHASWQRCGTTPLPYRQVTSRGLASGCNPVQGLYGAMCWCGRQVHRPFPCQRPETLFGTQARCRTSTGLNLPPSGQSPSKLQGLNDPNTMRRLASRGCRCKTVHMKTCGAQKYTQGCR